MPFSLGKLSHYAHWFLCAHIHHWVAWTTIDVHPPWTSAPVVSIIFAYGFNQNWVHFTERFLRFILWFIRFFAQHAVRSRCGLRLSKPSSDDKDREVGACGCLSVCDITLEMSRFKQAHTPHRIGFAKLTSVPPFIVQAITLVLKRGTKVLHDVIRLRASFANPKFWRSRDTCFPAWAC